MGKILWAIEVKTSLNLAVISQANYWLHRTHYVSVAVPVVKRTNARDFAFSLLSNLGIGLLKVGEIGYRKTIGVEEMIPPKLHRKVSLNHNYRSYSRTCKLLNEKQKTYAPAGNSYGRRWSPFKDTCDQLAALVKKLPGISMKEALDKITHHYSSVSSARGSLSHWISEGKVLGVRIEREGRLLKLFPTKDIEK